MPGCCCRSHSTSRPSCRERSRHRCGSRRRRKGGLLNTIERIGDKVPHPAVIFIGLCALVIVLSQVLYLFDVHVTNEVIEPVPIEAQPSYPAGSGIPELVPEKGNEGAVYEQDYQVVTETTKIEGLLTPNGLRFLFTSPVQNFNGFGVVGVILVAMVGVGVAERCGSDRARSSDVSSKGRLHGRSRTSSCSSACVSSVASDAGYLVLIPLGAAAFYSLGRHPLAGVCAAFAGVSAGFGVNILITPFDGVLAEVTTEAARLADPNASVGITDNWYLRHRFDAVPHVRHDHRGPDESSSRASARTPTRPTSTTSEEEHDPASEARGIKFAGYAMLAAVVGILLLVVPPERGAAQPGDRIDHRRLAVHGQHPRADHDHLPGRWHRLRHRRQHIARRHGDHRCDHQDLRRSCRPDPAAADHRPVHRLLQLQQHGDGRWRRAWPTS